MSYIIYNIFQVKEPQTGSTLTEKVHCTTNCNTFETEYNRYLKFNFLINGLCYHSNKICTVL